MMTVVAHTLSPQKMSLAKSVKSNQLTISLFNCVILSIMFQADIYNLKINLSEVGELSNEQLHT